MKPRVLLVDDDAALLDVFRDELPRHGFAVETARSAEEVLGRAAQASWDAVVTDLNMRGTSGLELARRLVDLRPDVPVLLLTAFGDMESAIAAIRAGVTDYLTKPVEVDALAHAIRRAVRERTLAREVERLRGLAGRTAGIEGIVTESAAMQPVLDLIARVAPTTTTVLVMGESGTGKELVARAIHQLGPHPLQPFVAVNCAAIPEALVESELFGHVRGAFTGAHAPKRGLLAAAGKGTIFLDEVGELPLAVQPKLLRALQERVIRPLGETKEEPIEARVVAATNRRLADDVEAGKFRQDLFYRLSVVEIALPPLRARGNDVLLLAQTFLARDAKRLGKSVRGISTAAAERLLHHRWPGNVRELANVIERAVTLARGDEVVPADLPPALLEEPKRPAHEADLLAPGDDISVLPTLDEVESRYIRRVLDAVSGNKTLAAKILGLDRKTLYRKLDKQDESATG